MLDIAITRKRTAHQKTKPISIARKLEQILLIHLMFSVGVLFPNYKLYNYATNINVFEMQFRFQFPILHFIFSNFILVVSIISTNRRFVV